MKAIGIVLIIVGILALGFQGFSYVTRDKVVDIGPVEVTREKTKNVYLPPILGAAALVAGIALTLTGARA